MARSLTAFVALILAVGSCGCASSRGAPAASVTPLPEQPAPSAVPVAATPRARTPASGLYHLSGQVDAMNLSLDLEAGTFRVGVDGCDYSHAAAGTARVEGDGVVLSGDFTWPEGAGFANEVETVLLWPAADGSLRARGEIGGRPFEQDWLAGGVCPECGHALGPSGQRACASPFLGR